MMHCFDWLVIQQQTYGHQLQIASFHIINNHGQKCTIHDNGVGQLSQSKNGCFEEHINNKNDGHIKGIEVRH
jgi:hypothetical protein